MAQAPSRTFTGRTRRRRTRLSVRIADFLARALISVGGIGTIGAVLMVCVFLVWVVLPLFLSARLDLAGDVATAHSKTPLHVGVDEYQVLGWAMQPDGSLDIFRLDTGEVVERRALFDEGELTATSVSTDGQSVALGFADGSVRLGTIRFEASYVEAEELPPALRALGVGEVAAYDQGILQRTPEGQFRWQRLSTDLELPVPSESGEAVVLLDHVRTPLGPKFVSLAADGELRVTGVRKRRNLRTGEETLLTSTGRLPYQTPSDHGAPQRLLLSGLGTYVYVLWEEGYLQRYATYDLANPVLAEELDVVEGGATVTAVGFVVGDSTLVIGDSAGGLNAWFCTKPADAPTPDGAVLKAAHRLAKGSAAVTHIAASPRSRIIAAGYADGRVRLYQVTAETLLADTEAPGGEAVHALVVSPKEDGLTAWTAAGQRRWDFEKRYPEITLSTLFRPVWYEGFEAPAHVWQSSSGSDDFEPKLGLMPLIFGTAKATFYSMLFGVPLALLAAVYSSEYLHASVKTRVKPTIELMASLPSVVLGFFAALVFAPVIERALPATMTWFVTGPMTLLLGAYAWQMLPSGISLRIVRWRLLMICLTLPAGIGAAVWLGPYVERWLFGGDIRLWLDGQVGDGTGGWLLLLLPLAAVAIAFVNGRLVNPRLRRLSANWSRQQNALLDFAKFAVVSIGVLGAALLASYGLSAAGLDPRGSYVGTYVQRNAMIVGFVMGFAIIPIIYTLAEDALSTVPDHLRSASLGAGATTWQTTVRVVIPTAMSGLFSAVMVGLGRAVGETMIVLMAAGNTPVMEWNIFNGFRTLSANIAVELPEAVRNSGHFRTLFLAALTLFALTFVINTAAEVVRQRFRKRAYQL